MFGFIVNLNKFMFTHSDFFIGFRRFGVGFNYGWLFFIELVPVGVLIYLVIRLDRFFKESGNFENAAKKLVGEGFSDRNWFVCLALWCFLGFFGAHRFYCGKVKTGILYMLTGGLFLVGLIVDICLMLAGEFKDCDEKIVKRF